MAERPCDRSLARLEKIKVSTKNNQSNGASLLEIFFPSLESGTLKKQVDTSVVSYNKNHLIITMFARERKEKG